MLNFGASKPRVRGGPGPPGPPLDPHLVLFIREFYLFLIFCKNNNRYQEVKSLFSCYTAQQLSSAQTMRKRMRKQKFSGMCLLS